jgi:hypothetical protein
MLVVGHVEGAHAIPMVHWFRRVEEDAAAVTKQLFVRLITKDRKIIVCMFVGEEDQAQEFAVDTCEVDMHAGKATC